MSIHFYLKEASFVERDIIYLDRLGLSRLQRELANEEELLKQIQLQRAESRSSVVDDGYNNPILNHFDMQESATKYRIRELKDKLSRVELIEVENNGDGTINIGSTITIKLSSDFDDDELTFILITGRPENIGKEVSTNCPLGKSILGKKVGDVVSYSVEDNQVTVTILNVVDPKQD